MEPTAFNRIGEVFGLSDITEVGEGYAILLTSIFVIIGWHINNLISTSTEMNKNTYALGEITSGTSLKEKLGVLSNYINNRSAIPLRKDMDETTRKAVSDVLNHLEYVASAVNVGYLSERYLFVTSGSMVCLIYIVSLRYILEMRSLRKVKTFYRNFEMLYIRYFFNSKSLFIKIPELIIGKKLFLASYFEFRIHYIFIRLMLDLPHKYTDNDQYVLKRIYFYYKWGMRGFIVYIIILYYLAYFS
ncbi:DUF4760 domain-containing protein [Xanthobacter sp. AM11]|uniref:DUF4760 domain-containing protein n=1 Tax=Xanthobacter sp. AM11 TaxID=3380643 RepID=UPI0039BFCC85